MFLFVMVCLILFFFVIEKIISGILLFIYNEEVVEFIIVSLFFKILIYVNVLYFIVLGISLGFVL